MAIAEEAPRGSFHVSMLWNDSRYRSSFIQIIALCLFMLVVAWLVSNTIRNLEALGKDFSFTFLWDPASYDINQVLFIDYTSRSPHWKAALAGILNTLLVAFMGCIAATIVGVLVGVLRLSKNWIVGRLMTFYVEVIRNIPVLLQIIVWSAVFVDIFPAPRDFRGEDSEAFMLFGEAVAITNRGVYAPRPIWEPGSTVVVVTFLASLVAIWFFRRYAFKRQERTGEILPILRVSLAIFFLPTLLVFFVAGQPIHLEYPELGGFNFNGGIYARESLLALWLGLSIYTSAFIAEIVRSGILSVSHGQTEAAFALGLKPNRTMQLVILPQALRVIIPPLISQYLNLTKNSSLAIAVGYMDATGTLGGITLNQTGREMETIMLLMLFYLIISLLISAVMNWYNKSVELKER